MSDAVRSFDERRNRGNDLILEGAPLAVKRFFALDQDVYGDGALPKRTKELLGLVASAVLRCDDCIAYHVREASRDGVSREELVESLSVALVVGGSITIPHMRRALEFFEELQAVEEQRRP